MKADNTPLCQGKHADWFPSGPGRKARAQLAAEACRRCPIVARTSCETLAIQLLLEYGELHGVWAGEVYALENR